MVFESKLQELFSLHVHCPNCGRNLQKASLKTKVSLATIECLGCCDQPLPWQTQPFISSMAAGNLLFSAGILFTGNDYSNIANFTKATNIQFFSQRSFSSTQKKYLFPIVNKKFAEHRVDIFNKVRNTEVVAGGDGRCDSPGHSAKYGTYSIVNTASSKVLDFSLVQVTEVKNSNAMELEGLKHCLDHLQREKVAIAKLATDRHMQVRAHMKKERPHIKHNFNVWHLAKSVQKKLSKKAQSKPCAALKPWINSPLVVCKNLARQCYRLCGMMEIHQCLTKDIIYQATVTTEQGSECYVGLTDTDFKSRFANHKQSFRNEAYSNQTELSKHVWQLKKAKIDYMIRWKILDRASHTLMQPKDANCVP